MARAALLALLAYGAHAFGGFGSTSEQRPSGSFAFYAARLPTIVDSGLTAPQGLVCGGGVRGTLLENSLDKGDPFY